MNSEVIPNETLTEVLIKCVNFAAIKHKDQRRLDPEKTPYINHPIGVAYILIHEAQITDTEVIQAALLHDTVEDTDTTLDEIEKEFGKPIRNIVNEVSDDKRLPKAVRKQLQIEHTPNSSHKAKLIKLADKLYNLRDLERSVPEGWTEERVRQYFEWSNQVVNGLKGTNTTLENKLDELFRKHDVL